MTYCVGLMLEQGLIFAADARDSEITSRSDRSCELSAYERGGDRVIVLLSSGDLTRSREVCALLGLGGADESESALWHAKTLQEVAMLIAGAVRKVVHFHAVRPGMRDAVLGASFILGGQVLGETPRLFRISSNADVLEADSQETYFQIGESAYGKPIIEWVVRCQTPLNDAARCLLASFDTTMRNSLTVATPFDLLTYRTDTLAVHMRRRFNAGSAYFADNSFP